MSNRVTIQIENHIAHVQLNRADKMNALDNEMFQQIIAAAETVSNDPTVRCVVLSGNGKAFCAGLDLSNFKMPGDGDINQQPLADRTHGMANKFQQVAWAWRQCPVPVIAAAHGVVFGGGLQIMLGVLIFLFVLYVVFQSVFAFSGYPMELIDQSISGLSSWTKQMLPQGWLNDLISDAIIQGIGGVLIFIPQIAILFFFLGLLEHSGYMSRISFIADNFLRKFGLSGKSIIPLMSSWACAIPAIMGTRVIDDPKERMAVIMASPLMTCSARLPVYTILIAVILPKEDGAFFGAQGLALLSLYLIGVIATLLVALYISKRSKMESNPFWSLELPVYRIPNWRNIFTNVYLKTKSFVIEAGKVILALLSLYLIGAIIGSNPLPRYPRYEYSIS